MNARSALFLFLIALTTGQAFGDLKAQLSELKEASTNLKELWTTMTENNEPIYALVELVQEKVDFLSNNVAELPDNSGTSLYDSSIQNLLRDTAKLLADSYDQSLTAVNKQLSDDEFIPGTPYMVRSIARMIDHITSTLQQKLAQWSNNLDGSRQSNLQVILVEHRRSLLEPLEMMAKKACEMEKGHWFHEIDGNQILYSLQRAAGKVTVASCNELFSCLDSLVPIADRIHKTAQCVIEDP